MSAVTKRASPVRVIAEDARRASRALASSTGKQRNNALEAMAGALEAAATEILAANVRDLDIAQKMRKAGELSAATVERLKLNRSKLAEMAAHVRSVAALPDPLHCTLDSIELDSGLDLEKLSVPLGVLAVIFEARPDAVTQIASLAIKSGNAVILKPGREVEHTAEALVRALHLALASCGLPVELVSLLQGRSQVGQLLQQHTLIDLVIPRGSRALVEYVQQHTRIPVLGHAEGVCHIYVDRDADPALALRVIDDAKTDYPAACNAVETVLIHRDIAKKFLPRLAARLTKRGVAIHACESSRELLLAAEFGEQAAIHDWHTEYGALAISIGIVDTLDAAINHIHAHGSQHTESIITRDPATAERFLNEVDAAGVFHNASTRFADGYRYGFGAEVGVSTSKIHARGPVGLEGLTTYKYILRGAGHIVSDYRGPNARPFTHKRAKSVTRARAR